MCDASCVTTPVLLVFVWPQCDRVVVTLKTKTMDPLMPTPTVIVPQEFSFQSTECDSIFASLGQVVVLPGHPLRRQSRSP